MRLSELVDALEEIAPTRQAESWDNVGLLVGDRAQKISRALLTIDYTPEVARECRQAKCDVVIAYHPPIFHPLKRILADSPIFDAIRRGIAIYSPHTALDVADGGTNDLLADMLDLKNRSPLRLIEPKAEQYKLVTFVPEKDLEKVSNALFEAGAGRIGNYTACSFRSAGTGTFFGEEGTNPTVGKAGRLEMSSEVRIETVVPIQKIDRIVRALRESHPYEEPAFDLNQLAAPPNALGQGRIGQLDPQMDPKPLFARIKKRLGINHLLIAGPADRPIRRAAVCAGACSDMLGDAIRQKADLYLTGEIRHHDAIKAATAGMTVVCTLHSNSERVVLKRLEKRLKKMLPGLQLLLSRMDRDPFSIR